MEVLPPQHQMQPVTYLIPLSPLNTMLTQSSVKIYASLEEAAEGRDPQTFWARAPQHPKSGEKICL